MRLGEYPSLYSKPVLPGYRANAPIEIKPPPVENRQAIIAAWEDFFDGEKPMAGVHMGILVNNIITLSGGFRYQDGHAAYVLDAPGGGIDVMVFQHRNSSLPGGEASVLITSNQPDGTIVEDISWGNITNRERSTLPVITRTRLTRDSSEPLHAHTWEQDGRKLLADIFTTALLRPTIPVAR